MTVILLHQKCKIGFLRTKIEFLKKLAEISIFNRVAKTKKKYAGVPMDGIGWKLVGMVYMTIWKNEAIARHIHQLQGLLGHLNQSLISIIKIIRKFQSTFKGHHILNWWKNHDHKKSPHVKKKCWTPKRVIELGSSYPQFFIRPMNLLYVFFALD